MHGRRFGRQLLSLDERANLSRRGKGCIRNIRLLHKYSFAMVPRAGGFKPDLSICSGSACVPLSPNGQVDEATGAMETEIEAVRRQLAALVAERRRLEERLCEPAGRTDAADRGPKATPMDPRVRVSIPPVTNGSSAADKIAIYRRLFDGRTDVFPVRWDTAPAPCRCRRR